MLRNLLSIVFICGFVFLSPPAQGRTENHCRATTDWDNLHEISTTDAKGRLYFYKRFIDCKETEPGCVIREKNYLVPGDQVLLSQVHPENKNWVCALYGKSAKRVSYGWLRGENLTKAGPTKLVSLNQLVGKWQAVHQTSFSSGTIVVSGKAGEEWKGSFFYKGNAGEFTAKGELRDNQVIIKEADCNVSFRLIVGYLVASDNKKCGGFNVTFDGAYVRQ